MSALFKAQSIADRDSDYHDAPQIRVGDIASSDPDGQPGDPTPPSDDDPASAPLHVWAQHAPQTGETQDQEDDVDNFNWFPFSGQLLSAPAKSLLGDSPLGPNLDLRSPASNGVSQSGLRPKQWALEDLITRAGQSPISSPSAPGSVAYTDGGSDFRLWNAATGSAARSGSFPTLSIPSPPSASDIPEGPAHDVGHPADQPQTSAKYAQNFAVQNHPVIDSTTEILLAELAASLHKWGTGFGALFGIKVHTDFGNRIRKLDLPGIGEDGVEQSFNLGELARYGAANSIRTDIFLRDKFGEPLAIYDVKTGNARLSRARVRELLEHVGREDNPIPVIQLNFNAGTAVMP